MNNKMYYKSRLACAVALLVSSNAVNAADCFGAAGYCLTDGNAEFQIDSFGVMELTVSGITHVYSTDFIIAEQSQDPLIPSPFPLSFYDYMDLNQPQGADPSHLTLAGLPVSTWGSATLDFQLIGDLPGSGNAGLVETFTLTNTSAAAVEVSMFAYTDVDISGPVGTEGAVDDRGELHAFDALGRPTAYRQWDKNSQLITSVDVAPDYYEVSLSNGCVFLDLCERIYYGVDTILPNTVESGKGDLNMAAQWFRTLGVGESFTYTQTMDLSNVPVPAAVWLFGSGLVGLIGVARRKQKA